MPKRPPRICGQPGCNELTHETYCEEHRTQRARHREHDASRGSSAERGYGHRWRKLRLMKLRRNPVCESQGCDQPATEVDHIIPKRDGGRDTMANLQSLCKRHHSQKTMREQSQRFKKPIDGINEGQ